MEIDLNKEETIILLAALSDLRGRIVKHGFEATTALELAKLTKDIGIDTSIEVGAMEGQLALAHKRKTIFNNLITKITPTVEKHKITSKDLMQVGMEWE